MASLLDSLDNTYSPSAAYSFEFKLRNTDGSIGEKLCELFFLLPPEEYSINEGYRITVNKTISDKGGWVDDFGNDFKKISIGGSLYTYYVGTPAKASGGSQSLPPLIRNYRNESIGIGQEFRKLANSFAQSIGLDIPALEIISGLDEFFKLRYILSRFRDAKTTESIKNDNVIAKKFPDVQSLLSKVKEGKKLFNDIAMIYHDYDDNNHYEIILDNFNMARSANDPHTINYKIDITGLREYNNQYSGIGELKKKENPFEIINDLVARINSLSEKFLTINNVPALVLSEITKMINIMTETSNSIKSIVKNIGLNALGEITSIEILAGDLTIAANEFVYSVTGLAFSDKNGKNLDDVFQRYHDDDPDYQITDEGFLETIRLGDETRETSISLEGVSKYFTEFEENISYDSDIRVINDNDFNQDINQDGERQENTLVIKNRLFYPVIQGDDLYTLANRFLGDYTMSSLIADVNGITNSDFDDDGLVGKNIIIPLLGSTTVTNTSFNLVYYRRDQVVTPKERQIQILGNDLRLDQDRVIIVDGNGDLALEYGEDCYFENIVDRIRYVKGFLNPIHPSWGMNVEFGQIPSSIFVNRLYEAIEQQISLDPRVEFVYVDREASSIKADTITVIVRHKPINGNEKITNIGDIVAGLLI